MISNYWRELDLRTLNAFGYPAENRLCALHMVDRKDGREQYRIGSFYREGKKLWWKDGVGSVMDPTEIRRRCLVLWSYVEPPASHKNTGEES